MKYYQWEVAQLWRQYKASAPGAGLGWDGLDWEGEDGMGWGGDGMGLRVGLGEEGR